MIYTQNSKEIIKYKQLLIKTKLKLHPKISKKKSIEFSIPFKQYFLAKDLFNLNLITLKKQDKIKPFFILGDEYILNISINQLDNEININTLSKNGFAVPVKYEYLYQYLLKYLDRPFLIELFTAYNNVAEKLFEQYYKND